MRVIKMKTMSEMKVRKKKWRSEELEAFATDIAAVGEEARSRLGPEDVAYLKKIKQLSRASEVLGRVFLHFSLDPMTWSFGVLLLGLHHQLETAEIGHSAL